MNKLEYIIKRQSINPSDIDYLLDLYDLHIGGKESQNYRECKCPGALRIILDDLTLWHRGIKTK
jgi:hypothetical protein